MPRGGQGSIGQVTREWIDVLGIESISFHEPSVVNSKIVDGPTQNLILGAYLPPLAMEHLIDVK